MPYTRLVRHSLKSGGDPDTSLEALGFASGYPLDLVAQCPAEPLGRHELITDRDAPGPFPPQESHWFEPLGSRDQ